MNFDHIYSQLNGYLGSLGSSNFTYVLLFMFVLPFARTILSPILIILSSLLNCVALIIAQINRTLTNIALLVIQFFNTLIISLSPRNDSKAPLVVSMLTLVAGILLGYFPIAARFSISTAAIYLAIATATALFLIKGLNTQKLLSPENLKLSRLIIAGVLLIACVYLAYPNAFKPSSSTAQADQSFGHDQIDGNYEAF